MALWSTVIALCGGMALLGFYVLSALEKRESARAGIPPETVADYVHAVIQANRTVYETHIVDKLQEKGVVEAAEHWRQEAALPLPAQFLIETGKLVADNGSGLKYRLASLTPIYVWNAPANDFERKGLEAVTAGTLVYLAISLAIAASMNRVERRYAIPGLIARGAVRE